jgi:hypothetical protein
MKPAELKAHEKHRLSRRKELNIPAIIAGVPDHDAWENIVTAARIDDRRTPPMRPTRKCWALRRWR